jgi:hypothetical protein
MTDRSARLSLFQIVVAAAAVCTLYLLAFGPCCWARHRFNSGAGAFELVYWPIGLLAHDGPPAVGDIIWNVATFGVAEDRAVYLPTHPFGHHSFHVPNKKIVGRQLHGARLFAGSMPGSPEGPRISIDPEELGSRSILHEWIGCVLKR